jgi:hypothetical protein
MDGWMDGWMKEKHYKYHDFIKFVDNMIPIPTLTPSSNKINKKSR